MKHPWSPHYPFLMIEDIRKYLHRARDYVDSLDSSLERFEDPPRLLDNRKENGVRQCIDRALHLLEITESELEVSEDDDN